MLQTPLCGILGEHETRQSSELGRLNCFGTLVLELVSNVGGWCFLHLHLICF